MDYTLIMLKLLDIIYGAPLAFLKATFGAPAKPTDPYKLGEWAYDYDSQAPNPFPEGSKAHEDYAKGYQSRMEMAIW